MPAAITTSVFTGATIRDGVIVNSGPRYAGGASEIGPPGNCRPGSTVCGPHATGITGSGLCGTATTGAGASGTTGTTGIASTGGWQGGFTGASIAATGAIAVGCWR